MMHSYHLRFEPLQRITKEQAAAAAAAAAAAQQQAVADSHNSGSARIRMVNPAGVVTASGQPGQIGLRLLDPVEPAVEHSLRLHKSHGRHFRNVVSATS